MVIDWQSKLYINQGLVNVNQSRWQALACAHPQMDEMDDCGMEESPYLCNRETYNFIKLML